MKRAWGTHGDGIEMEIVVDAEEELSRIDRIAGRPPVSTGEQEANVQR